jgi:hypothetical protein
MYRGTTPTLTLELDTDVSLANLAEMWVTFKTPTAEVNKTLSDVTIDDTNKTIQVPLSQLDTLEINNRSCAVQVRFKTAGGQAYATTISNIDVENILKEGVI